MGHVTKDGEDGEPRDEAGDTVDGAGEQGIPERKESTVSSSGLTLPNPAYGLLDHLWNPRLQMPTPSSASLLPHGPPAPHHHRVRNCRCRK